MEDGFRGKSVDEHKAVSSDQVALVPRTVTSFLFLHHLHFTYKLIYDTWQRAVDLGGSYLGIHFDNILFGNFSSSEI